MMIYFKRELGLDRALILTMRCRECDVRAEQLIYLRDEPALKTDSRFLLELLMGHGCSHAWEFRENRDAAGK